MKIIKKLWKKCKIVIIVEILVIAALCGCFSLTYKLTYKLESQKAYSTIEKMGMLDDTDAGESVDDYLTYNWTNFLSSTSVLDLENRDKYWGYAFIWNVFDIYGDVLVEGTGNDLMIIWDDNNSETECNTFLIEKYFSEEEMEGFWEFYSSRDNMTSDTLYIDKVVGYYNEKKEYVPVEISFSDYNQLNDRVKTKTYILRNEKNADKEGVTYITRRGDSKYSADISVDEEGTFSVSAFKKSLPSLVEETRSVFDGADYRNEDYIYWSDQYWFDTIAVEDEADIKLGGTRISFCADMKYLTLTNYDFRKYVKYEIIFSQLIGFVIMYILYKNDERRKYLDSMKYTFINAMAHEMKTPSAVIVNSVECINDGIKPEKQSKYLNKVKKEGLHMNQLLLDMLTYTKLTDEDRKLNKEEIDMQEVFEQVMEHYTDAIEKRKIEVQWDIKSENKIMADRKLMEMVIDNYLSNAVKYCKQMGIIRISMDGRNIVVYNDGESIHPTKLKAIWEPLYVMDKSRKSREGSSGMGLAISAKILELHGMKYGTRNVDGGVEFYITTK